MKLLVASIALFLMAATGVSAQTAQSQVEVMLRVHTSGNTSSLIVGPAMSEASRVLGTAGVRIRWEFAGRPRNHDVHDCEGTAGQVIDLLLTDRGTKDAHVGVLGYAMPLARTGTQVVIFTDPVAALAPLSKRTLLGYTIAHEVGHILIGTFSHSPSGVMQAHWRPADYSLMTVLLLSFTAEDADTMRGHVRHNTNSCMAERMLADRMNARAAEQ